MSRTRTDTEMVQEIHRQLIARLFMKPEYKLALDESKRKDDDLYHMLESNTPALKDMIAEERKKQGKNAPISGIDNEIVKRFLAVLTVSTSDAQVELKFPDKFATLASGLNNINRKAGKAGEKAVNDAVAGLKDLASTDEEYKAELEDKAELRLLLENHRPELLEIFRARDFGNAKQLQSYIGSFLNPNNDENAIRVDFDLLISYGAISSLPTDLIKGLADANARVQAKRDAAAAAAVAAGLAAAADDKVVAAILATFTQPTDNSDLGFEQSALNEQVGKAARKMLSDEPIKSLSPEQKEGALFKVFHPSSGLDGFLRKPILSPDFKAPVGVNEKAVKAQLDAFNIEVKGLFNAAKVNHDAALVKLNKANELRDAWATYLDPTSVDTVMGYAKTVGEEEEYFAHDLAQILTRASIPTKTEEEAKGALEEVRERAVKLKLDKELEELAGAQKAIRDMGEPLPPGAVTALKDLVTFAAELDAAKVRLDARIEAGLKSVEANVNEMINAQHRLVLNGQFVREQVEFKIDEAKKAAVVPIFASSAAPVNLAEVQVQIAAAEKQHAAALEHQRKVENLLKEAKALCDTSFGTVVPPAAVAHLEAAKALYDAAQVDLLAQAIKNVSDASNLRKEKISAKKEIERKYVDDMYAELKPMLNKFVEFKSLVEDDKVLPVLISMKDVIGIIFEDPNNGLDTPRKQAEFFRAIMEAEELTTEQRDELFKGKLNGLPDPVADVIAFKVNINLLIKPAIEKRKELEEKFVNDVVDNLKGPVITQADRDAARLNGKPEPTENLPEYDRALLKAELMKCKTALYLSGSPKDPDKNIVEVANKLAPGLKLNLVKDEAQIIAAVHGIDRVELVAPILLNLNLRANPDLTKNFSAVDAEAKRVIEANYRDYTRDIKAARLQAHKGMDDPLIRAKAQADWNNTWAPMLEQITAHAKEARGLCNRYEAQMNAIKVINEQLLKQKPPWIKIRHSLASPFDKEVSLTPEGERNSEAIEAICLKRLNNDNLGAYINNANLFLKKSATSSGSYMEKRKAALNVIADKLENEVNSLKDLQEDVEKLQSRGTKIYEQHKVSEFKYTSIASFRAEIKNDEDPAHMALRAKVGVDKEIKPKLELQVSRIQVSENNVAYLGAIPIGETKDGKVVACEGLVLYTPHFHRTNFLLKDSGPSGSINNAIYKADGDPNTFWNAYTENPITEKGIKAYLEIKRDSGLIDLGYFDSGKYAKQMMADYNRQARQPDRPELVSDSLLAAAFEYVQLLAKTYPGQQVDLGGTSYEDNLAFRIVCAGFRHCIGHLPEYTPNDHSGFPGPTPQQIEQGKRFVSKQLITKVTTSFDYDEKAVALAAMKAGAPSAVDQKAYAKAVEDAKAKNKDLKIAPADEPKHTGYKRI